MRKPIKTYRLFESEQDIKSVAEDVREKFVAAHNYDIGDGKKWNGEPAYFGWFHDQKMKPKDYDSKYVITDRKDHPLWVTCKGGAGQIFTAMKAAGHSVKLVTGWYMSGKDYYQAGGSTFMRGSDVDINTSGYEHWWTEVDGEYYVDITSDQFWPSLPEEQAKHAVVVAEKQDVLKKFYYPIKRDYDEKVEPTKDPKLLKAAEMLFKKASRFKAGFRDTVVLATYIVANKTALGLSDVQTADLTASVRNLQNKMITLATMELAVQFVSQTV